MQGPEPFPFLLPPSLPAAAPPGPGYQVVLGLGHVGIIRPEACGVDFQCPPVVVFYLLSFALVLAEQCQVAQLLGHVWMKFSQDLGWEQKPVARLRAGLGPLPGLPSPACSHLLPDLQCPLAQRLGLLVLAPLAVQNCQVV